MIELVGLSKSYDCGTVIVDAVKNVNMKVERGEFITIMGPSGSGKSTLLHMLGLLDVFSSGSYLLEGRPVDNVQDAELARIRNKHIGFIFQSFNLLQEFTAIENVMMPMIYANISRKEKVEKAYYLLEKLGLKERVGHYPNMMSGGEQQRVAIARSLANDPAFILADEPTGNLPSSMSVNILKLLLELNNEGVTIIMVTHNPQIGKCGKREIRLKDGIIVSDNKINEPLNPDLIFVED